MVFTFVFWVGFLFPQAFEFLSLGSWRADNGDVMAWGVIVTSILVLVALLVKLDDWISRKLIRRRDKRDFNMLLSGLSPDELVYLLSVHSQSDSTHRI